MEDAIGNGIEFIGKWNEQHSNMELETLEMKLDTLENKIGNIESR